VVPAAQFLIVLDLWMVKITLPTLQHDFALRRCRTSHGSSLICCRALPAAGAAVLMPLHGARAVDVPDTSARHCGRGLRCSRRVSLAAHEIPAFVTVVDRLLRNSAGK